MIEKTVYDYLKTSLEESVYMAVPKDTTDKTFVVIEKTGSGRDNRIERSTFAIQSYADTLLHAAQLNEKVKEAMDNIIELNAICHSSLSSDYNYTDTTTKHYRYQAVYDLIHY